MVKRMLCILLLVMLCLTCAIAEEPGVRLSIQGYVIEQTTDTEGVLHLLLYKDGTSAYRMEGLELYLLDETGSILETTAADPVVFPLQSIPAGGHYVPVTVCYTLAEPGIVADFQIMGVSGVQVASVGVEECPVGVPWMSFTMAGELMFTVWVSMEEGTVAEDYFMTLVGADNDWHYVGNGELPAGLARYVSGEEIYDVVRTAGDLTDAEMEAMGFSFEAESYAFFDVVPLPYLSQTPANFIVTAYQKVPVTYAMPITRYIDRLEMMEDGSFTIHGCFECGMDGYWKLAGVDSVTLLAADGREMEVADFSFDAPFAVLEEGFFLPYTITGRVEPDFVAEDFRLGYGVLSAQEADFHIVSGGDLVLGVDADGLITLDATMFADQGLDVRNCFVIVMFLDWQNDVYQGAVWTYPGEGWMQDGEIHLPQMTAPQGCTLEAAMVTMYCVAQ